MPRRARPSRSSGSSCSRMRHIGPASPVVPVRERAGHRRWRCAHESGVIADGTCHRASRRRRVEGRAPDTEARPTTLPRCCPQRSARKSALLAGTWVVARFRSRPASFQSRRPAHLVLTNTSERREKTCPVFARTRIGVTARPLASPRTPPEAPYAFSAFSPALVACRLTRPRSMIGADCAAVDAVPDLRLPAVSSLAESICKEGKFDLSCWSGYGQARRTLLRSRPHQLEELRLKCRYSIVSAMTPSAAWDAPVSNRYGSQVRRSSR
jgi:hypothetical protein